MNQNLSILRRSASRLLAASLLEIDPSLLLVQGGELMMGFYYDFIPSREVSLPFLHLAEERMRQLIKGNHPIEIMEMVAKNGWDYVQHLGHHAFVEEEMENEKKILSFFRMKDFVDPCVPPFIKSTKEVAYFRLLSLKKLGKSQYRIIGSVHYNDKAVKEESRLFSRYEKNNHLIFGKSEELFHLEEKGVFWHPQGVCLKKICVEFWQEEIEKQNFSLLETPSCRKREEKIAQHQGFFASTGNPLPLRTGELFEEENTKEKEILLEGLLNPVLGHRTLELSFVSQKELLNEVISSLQFIDKILNIFNFSNCHAWVFSSGRRARMFAEEEIFMEALKRVGIPFRREERGGKELRIEVDIKDSLGREWIGSYLSLHKGEEKVMILERSTFGLLERWIALWIEHTPERVAQVLKRKKICIESSN